jgi:CubicO group peptidase (beta-lactamase class C family)
MRFLISFLLLAILPPSSGLAGTEVIDKFMTDFIAENKVPGAAIAVTRHGKLVYARGFGWADKESQEPVKPISLFRIASISKPITAVAIMQLVEARKLRLSDPIGTHLPAMRSYRRHPNFDNRINRITIQDLLRHSGGWDRDKSFDPMGLTGHLRVAQELNIAPPVDTRDVITFMFRRPLQFDPGTDYAYSNFGYLLLGRIIENVTGEKYESYVKKHVLAPIGVTTMQIGHMEKERRVANEVTYYDHKGRTATAPYGRQKNRTVPNTYARPMQYMDAHGGWIASAVDLARFANSLDQLLKPGSLNTMFDRQPGILGHDDRGQPKAAYYALGWMVRPQQRRANEWHGGSIQGTSTLLVRRHDGFQWAILFNTNANPNDKNLSGLIDGPMHGVITSAKTWPDLDQFDSF